MKEHHDKLVFGFWLYLMSDCVLFAGLFAVYATLQHATFGGPEIYDLVQLPFVLGETLLLLTSSFTMGLALLWSRSNRRLVLGALSVTLLLGLGFLGMEVSEFIQLVADGAGPAHSAFLSSFFTLLGTHGLHVFAGCVWMLVVLGRALGGVAPQPRAFLCLALFWHFLDVVWVCIFTFVYLFGALAV